MRAALCKSLDGPDGLVIEAIPEPEPAAGEVLVRVKAAGVNFFDTLITRGKYQYKPAPPFSPCGELSGVVEAVGAGITGLFPGDRVCGYVGWGAAREKLLARPEQLARIPDGVGDDTAAGISVTYGTAIHGLKDRGRLAAGETVAVLGASGGAGLAAVEIAKMMGARVIAVASSAAKLAICRRHGADLLFNYAEGDLKQGLRELTNGQGVDVIYDCVGGPHAEAALRSIAWQGRYLVIGFAAGAIPKIPLNLLLLKGCDCNGVFWAEWTARNPAGHRDNMAMVLAAIARGELQPHVSMAYPLEQVAEAIGALDRRATTGKLILTM